MRPVGQPRAIGTALGIEDKLCVCVTCFRLFSLFSLGSLARVRKEKAWAGQLGARSGCGRCDGRGRCCCCASGGRRRSWRRRRRCGRRGSRRQRAVDAATLDVDVVPRAPSRILETRARRSARAVSVGAVAASSLAITRSQRGAARERSMPHACHTRRSACMASMPARCAATAHSLASL